MAKQEGLPLYRLLSETWRGRVAVVVFFGLCQAYAIRVVMSVALGPISTEYGYDNPTKGLILSAFFQGYIGLQLVGGLAATKVGAYGILIAGILMPSVLTLLTPFVAGNLPALVTLRVLTGFFEGVTYPALHAMIGRWAPAEERSTLTTTMWSGGFAGTFMTLPLAGSICGNGLSMFGATGWRVAFYLFGAFGISWTVMFAILASSSPETHPFISAKERAYIIARRTQFGSKEVEKKGGEDEEREVVSDREALLLADAETAKNSIAAAAATTEPIPWAALFRCKAFLGCVIGQTTHNFGFYLLLTWLPQYLSQQLNFNVENAGVLSFLPYMACFIGSNVGAAVTDGLIGRGWSVLRVRQAAFTIGEVIPAIALVAAGYCTDATTVIALLTISVGCSGVSVPAIACTPIDIAPHLAGAQMGVMNTAGTVSGIIAPLVVGAFIAAPHDDQLHWQYVFWLTAGINLVGWAAYVGWARDDLVPELQPGVKKDVKTDEVNMVHMPHNCEFVES